jgi:hypothetical protein
MLRWGVTQRHKWRNLSVNRLRPAGLELKDCGKDGNCMFHCISDQLSGDGGEGHAGVRAAVHDWLVENEEARGLSGFVAYERMHLKQGDWVGYVGKLAKDGRKGGLWGDHLCLTAAAAVWRRPIKVFSTEEGSDATIEPPHGCELQPQEASSAAALGCSVLRVAHLPEVHYRSVINRAMPAR